MAVKLRLSRFGKPHVAQYRLSAIDAKRARDSRVIESLGYYHPQDRDVRKQFVANLERCRYWLTVGAQPSDTVAALLRKSGIRHKTLGNPDGNGSVHIQQVVDTDESTTINWLIEAMYRAKVPQMSSGRMMANAGNQRISVLDFQATCEHERPIHLVQMKAVVKEGVLHFMSGKPIEEVVPLILARRATQVFFDVSDTPPKSILSEAARIHQQITARASLWEPVVVGPVPQATGPLAEALAKVQVRTTGMTYDEYCADLRDHRRFVDSVRTNPQGRKDTRR